MTRSLTGPKIGPTDQALSEANDLEMKARVEEILNRHPAVGLAVGVGILRHVLDIPGDMIPTAVPHHPEIWSDICGWYAFPGSLRDLQKWAVAGVQVFVRRGQLTLRLVTPIPGLPREFPLHPEDDEDPGLFRIDLSALGMGTSRVVFSRAPDKGTAALHVELPGIPMPFQKQPATRDPRMWAKGALGALGIATAAAAVQRRRGPCKEVRS